MGIVSWTGHEVCPSLGYLEKGVMITPLILPRGEENKTTLYSETSGNTGCDYDCISVPGMVNPAGCVQPSPTVAQKATHLQTHGP